MKRTKGIIFGLILGTALCVPSASIAQDARDQSHKTYYDASHKDRHEWNDNEDAAWNRYRDEHHVKQTDFAKASKKQQQAYWNWRHDHPDQH